LVQIQENYTVFNNSTSIGFKLFTVIKLIVRLSSR